MNSEKGDKNQNTCARWMWSCPSAMVTAATGSLWPARATRGCGACPKGGAKRCRLEDKRARSRAVDPQHSRWALEGMSRPAHGLLLGILELSPRDSARAISSFSFKYPVPPALLGPSCLQTSTSPARRDVRLRLPHRPRCYFRRALHRLWRLMRVRLYSSVRVRYTLTPSLSQCLRRPQHAGLQLLQAISTRCLVVQVLGAFPTFIRARHVP